MSQATATNELLQPIQSAKDSATRSKAPGWLIAVAKSGYAARGVIYLIIGTMAILKALGEGGDSTDSKGALSKLLDAPGGQAMLWVMAAGLVCYSAWRFCQAILDADDHGKSCKGIIVRGGLLASCITHLGLAYYAGMAAYQRTQDEGGGKEALVGKIMGWPAGRFIVAGLGLAIIGAGVAHALKAHKEKYEKHFVISRSTMDKLEPICKFGLYCRSVVFAIIGSMILYAAFTQDADDAGGLREVLDAAAGQPFGTALLGAMAGGLFAFGLYSIFEAIFRMIDGPGD